MNMDLALLRENCIEIATCFYQDKIKDGLGMLESVLEMVLRVPEFTDLVNPLLEAVQNEDYVLAADIFYHEMVLRIE